MHIDELERQNRLISAQTEQIQAINRQLVEQVALSKAAGDTINYFATSLFGKNSVDEILWDVAKNCISRLGLVDCVIYLIDRERNVLVQKAAFGTKNPEAFDILGPIEIPINSGIVGAVARTGVAEIVNDTSKDERYIVDDEARLSELSVPLIIKGEVIGVIDSEHPEKDFFTRYHLETLTTISVICASKISYAEEEIREQRMKEVEREAAQIKYLDKMKSELFANVSHEFRTPLTLILAPLTKGESLTEIETAMITRNARRLLRLVNQLLDHARLENGLLKPQLRSIKVLEYISDIAYAFKPGADAKGLVLRINVPQSGLVISIDPDAVEKIIYNLLSNAIKFTPKGGEVSIDVTVSADVIQIDVSDTGIGIAPDDQQKVFTRYFQIDQAVQENAGSGIGLALTKELVHMIGGTIRLESTAGKGSTFTLAFGYSPLTVPASRIESPEVVGYYDDYSETPYVGEVRDGRSDLPLLLMVEDNRELREYIGEQLSLKYNVILASDGEQGYGMAAQRVPDLIISDIMMPVMDGLEMLHKIRADEKTSHIPVILLTAREDMESKIRGFSSGAEQYLVKPFGMNELTARIESLLARSKILRRKFAREVWLQPSDVMVPERDGVFIQRMVKIVEDNMIEPDFGVEQLQQGMAMSRMQLHRKLKALMDMSAGDFIRSVKLNRAAQLLSQSGMPVAEAAYLSGYGNMSYFSKCFREQFGMNPSEYSKAHASH